MWEETHVSQTISYPRDHFRTEAPLVRLLRQAAVRSDRALRPGHGSGLRAPLAPARRRDQGRHDRSARRRPLDRVGRQPRLVLAAGLHATMAARLPQRSHLERSRRRRFVCHILDIHTGRKRTIPAPIYTISPDGKQAVAPDFRRINDCRPGYGYTGIPDPYRDQLAPEQTGIWHIDLTTGASKLIISFAQMTAIPSRLGRHHGDEALVQSSALGADERPL